MISIQHSQDSQNQKPCTQRSTDMTTDLTQTLTLNLICETNEPSQVKVDDLLKSLSAEIPSYDLINEYSCLFTIQLQPTYLISSQNLKKLKCNEEQLGIGGNGSVFLCTDLGTLELHAVKVISDINFDNVNPILYECINQYHLMQLNKEMILNIVNLIQIRVVNSKVDFQIPLELAEFSLYDYIQTNEINEEIYNQITNILIDFLILLHSNNYAHRDIKPQNILFVKDVGWKLADFGESINYEVSKGMHKIKGTLAFIPQDIRKHSKSNKEILQDLFRNDVYATVCTLVMIKNPQFRSQDLQIYMSDNQFDAICQRLINITQVEDLHQFKQEKLSKFQYSGKLINHKDELVFYDVKIIIKLYSQLNKKLENKIISIIDNELGKLKENNKIVDYNKVVILLIQYFPFQLDKFKNLNDQFDHNVILKNPQQYFSNIIELCQFYFDRGFNQQLLEIKYQQNPSSDSLDSIFIRFYVNMLYRDLENAKILLNILANKLYSETSQINSDFLGYYNQMYYQLHNEFPIIKLEQDILMKQLQDFQSKELNEQDIKDYLQIKSFKPGGNLNLQALFHPLSPQFIRFRNQQIFEHIIYHIGCNSEQIQQNKSLLSELIKGHLQLNNSHSKDLQLIIQGCIILYQNYDLLYELLDLLIYFSKVLALTKPGMHNLELRVEIQRLVIKYNLNVDYKIKLFHQNPLVINNYLGLYDYIIFLIHSNIYNLQLKIIKSQFKQRAMNNFKLTFAVDLLKSLKQIQNQKFNQYKLYDLQNFLFYCILQQKSKIQQRFLQGTIVIFQQSTTKEQFIKHLSDLRQYNRIRNNYNKDFNQVPKHHRTIIAQISFKYHTLNKLLKYYPKLAYELLDTCYTSNQKLFQNQQQHINAIRICPSLKKRIPINNQNLKQMYLYN
ncbi:Calcium-dependent protein kinase 20 [Paramecium bursaria]